MPLIFFSQMFVSVGSLYIPISVLTGLLFLLISHKKCIQEIKALKYSIKLFLFSVLGLSFIAFLISVFQSIITSTTFNPAFCQYVLGIVGLFPGLILLKNSIDLKIIIFGANVGMLVGLAITNIFGNFSNIKYSSDAIFPTLPGFIQPYQYYQYSGIIAIALIACSAFFLKFDIKWKIVYFLFFTLYAILIRSAHSEFFQIGLSLIAFFLIFKNVKKAVIIFIPICAALVCTFQFSVQGLVSRFALWDSLIEEIICLENLFGRWFPSNETRLWCHNQWLDFIYRFGIIFGGFLLLMFINVALFLFKLAIRTKNWIRQEAACCAFGSFIIFVLASAVTVPLGQPNVALTAYFFLGLAIKSNLLFNKTLKNRRES